MRCVQVAIVRCGFGFVVSNFVEQLLDDLGVLAATLLDSPISTLKSNKIG